MDKRLEKAVKNGDLESLQGLLREHPQWIHSRTGNEENLVVLATRHQKSECLEFLLESKISAKVPNQAQVTALMMAAGEKTAQSLRCLELLLPHSDLNAQDRDGWSALYYAVLDQNYAGVGSLLRCGADATLVEPASRDSPLHAAILSMDAELLTMLIPYSRINDQDKRGRSALMLAAERKWVFATEVLSPLSDHTLVNSQGQTAFEVAIERAKRAEALSQHSIDSWACVDTLAMHLDPQFVIALVQQTQPLLKELPFVTALMEHAALNKSLGGTVEETRELNRVAPGPEDSATAEQEGCKPQRPPQGQKRTGDLVRAKRRL